MGHIPTEPENVHFEELSADNGAATRSNMAVGDVAHGALWVKRCAFTLGGAPQASI